MYGKSGTILKKWQDCLKKYSKQTNEQIQLIQALESVCMSHDRLYFNLFSSVLQLLHVNFNILSEDAILVWEESRKLTSGGNNHLLLKQAISFLTWLHEAEEDEEEDEEDADN